jgi:hypothetical protein
MSSARRTTAQIVEPDNEDHDTEPLALARAERDALADKLESSEQASKASASQWGKEIRSLTKQFVEATKRVRAMEKQGVMPLFNRDTDEE